MKKILIVFIFLSISVFGQVSLNNDISNLSYENPIEFEIGGVIVTGIDNLDKNAIITISDLKVGEKILIPGEKISKAIKNLWDQNLFESIDINIVKIVNNNIFLEINLKQLPKLSKYSLNGLKKGEKSKIRDKINLTKGQVVNENLITNTEQIIKNYYIEKGFPKISVSTNSKFDSADNKNITLDIYIDKGEKIKINEIIFSGNFSFEDKKLKRKLKDTKEKKIFRLFKTSKLLTEKFNDDLNNLIQFYNEQGYRDARIKNQKINYNSNNLMNIEINIHEGNKFYYRNINFLGNSKHSSSFLNSILGISKGDLYDEKLLNERINANALGNDISSLYMDDGYLFFNIEAVEVLVENDSIDLEIIIYEGKQAKINKIEVSGNTKTNDHVIMREIRTNPGELFSRSNISRSIEQLTRLNYFDPQNIGVLPNPDPISGNVDIKYTLEEKSSDQLSLSGSWGAGRLFGTFGVSFNNFSLKNILTKTNGSRLPSGDGQSISLNATSNGSFYQGYSFSFNEPWLGGKKPNSLNFTIYRSIQDYSTDEIENKMDLIGINLGLGKRLKWPDDYFTINNSINFQKYTLSNRQLVPGFSNGISKNLSYRATLSRSSIFDPIYPKTGSQFTINGNFTPPYSLIFNRDGNLMTLAEKYEWLEYIKVKLNGTWYTNPLGNLVFKTHSEFGVIRPYNNSIGIPPFERFYVGGDGLNVFMLDGREVIGLRGYANQSVSSHLTGGGSIYSKYTLELRYPLSLNPTSTIYATIFAEGGNAWESPTSFNPFEIKRSIGTGIRIFMPMIGILGVDFGYGFDSLPGSIEKSGWQTHFSIGQQF